MTNPSKAERHATLGTEGGKGVLKSACTALLFSLVLSTLLLLLSALVFSLKPEWTFSIHTVGCVLGALMMLFGGFLAGKRQRHTGALAGILFGLMLLAVLLLIGHFFGGGTHPIKRVVGYIIFLLLATLGGALGTVEIGHGRHKRRRR